MKMEQSVPKRRHIKFRRQGITQKKAYNKHIQSNSFRVYSPHYEYLRSVLISCFDLPDGTLPSRSVLWQEQSLIWSLNWERNFVSCIDIIELMYESKSRRCKVWRPNGNEVSYLSSGLDSGSVPAIQGSMSTFFDRSHPFVLYIIHKVIYAVKHNTYVVYNIIYNKPTRCNSGSIVFIKNYKYALHVSDALCVHLQEHYKL